MDDTTELLLRDAKPFERLVLGRVQRQAQLTRKVLARHVELRRDLRNGHVYGKGRLGQRLSSSLLHGAHDRDHKPTHNCKRQPKALLARQVE